jgi:hypothetical protein
MCDEAVNDRSGGDDGGYVVKYELPPDQRASAALLGALDAAGADLQGNEPLAEAIDPGALDDMLAADRTRGTGFERIFAEIWGYDVTITAEEIVIREDDD